MDLYSYLLLYIFFLVLTMINAVVQINHIFKAR